MSAAHANAQTIDLSSGAADPIWRGDVAGARAGHWLDQGAISHGDSRRDLVVGVPGDATMAGRVYVLFGGPVRTGNLPLSSADTVVNGAAAGDLFGAATATGNIRNLEGTFPKTLVVGAPGALGNKGVVYVYDTGFRGGDVVSTSAAVSQIVGATGDQLGTSLATADLNNDGYREILIGAPGSGRIYVIAGGATLSGTIDLSVQSAAVTFTYPGLGHNLAAGDITGDGIYDLLVGIEAANVVNVLKGRNGTMPPPVFDMTFGGIQPGDGVGSSVRLADVDADGRSDIIVGAPNADGPSDSRPDAGEVYLIWGGPTVTGRSLATADVTFFGSEAGARMGASLSAGDINRDIPNDLVFVSPGGRSGAGTIQLYYGRKNRSSIGVAAGDGTRHVDFAAEAPNRSILGDTGGGSITASIVYEVTGEGARDVIVGMSGNNGNVGAVYFTISPRFTLSDNSVSVAAVSGQAGSASVTVRNISEIGVTWRTSTDRAWLAATAQGSASAAASGTIVITANGSGLAPGVYTGSVTVTSTSTDLVMFKTIAVRFKVKATLFDDLLLWQNTASGQVTAWNMSGPPDQEMESWEHWSALDLPEWKAAATGDFNRDGNIDLVWQNESTRQVTVWYLGRDANGEPVRLGWSYLSSSGVPGWRVVGTGDFNNDGWPDIVWQNDSTRQVTVWYLGGAQGDAFLGWASLAASVPGWRVAGVNDFNADSRPDLVWQNDSTRQVTVWYLGGAKGDVFLGWSYLSSGGVPGWTVIGARDFSQDGRPDLVWQNDSDDQVTVWYLGGPEGNTFLGWDHLASGGVSGWRAFAR